MSTVLVTSSRRPHHNTQRVADALSDVLDARIVTPEEATPDLLLAADRVGFGSGVYNMSFDKRNFDCVRRLPDMSGREAFVFGTSGLPEPPFRRYIARFERVLTAQGFRVVGTFVCRGWDTWGPFGLIGGVSKGRPNDTDLEDARRFATTLTSTAHT